MIKEVQENRDTAKNIVSHQYRKKACFCVFKDLSIEVFNQIGGINNLSDISMGKSKKTVNSSQFSRRSGTVTPAI